MTVKISSLYHAQQKQTLIFLFCLIYFCSNMHMEKVKRYSKQIVIIIHFLYINKAAGFLV